MALAFEILRELPTPCYVIDVDRFNANIADLQKALESKWSNWAVGYSVKTNNLPWVLKHVKSQACMAEVVSSDEYELARLCGYAPKEIIFNGPVKGFDQFKECILNGGIVNIDAEREIAWVEEIASSGHHVNVGIRVNFDIDSILPDDIGCGEYGTRFGFSVETGAFGKTVEALSAMPNVSIVGLHMHSTSKTRSVMVYSCLSQMAVKIIQKYNLSLKYVDMGGGFFGDVPGKPSFEEYVDAMVSELSKVTNPEATALIVEPGSALVASPICMVSSVVDVKDVARARVAVLDTGRPNIDPLHIKKGYQYKLLSDARAAFPEQVLAGFTCMETDRIMALADEPELSPGDRVIFERVGSYTISLNPLFITLFPAVYAVEGQSCVCVRDKWTVDRVM